MLPFLFSVADHMQALLEIRQKTPENETVLIIILTTTRICFPTGSIHLFALQHRCRDASTSKGGVETE